MITTKHNNAWCGGQSTYHDIKVSSPIRSLADDCGAAQLGEVCFHAMQLPIGPQRSCTEAGGSYNSAGDTRGCRHGASATSDVHNGDHATLDPRHKQGGCDIPRIDCADVGTVMKCSATGGPRYTRTQAFKRARAATDQATWGKVHNSKGINPVRRALWSQHPHDGCTAHVHQQYGTAGSSHSHPVPATQSNVAEI